jgi:hypothetical protein
MLFVPRSAAANAKKPKCVSFGLTRHNDLDLPLIQRCVVFGITPMVAFFVLFCDNGSLCFDSASSLNL